MRRRRCEAGAPSPGFALPVARRGVRGGRRLMRSYDSIYVDGAFVAPAGAERIEIISPHTEQVIASAPEGTRADMDRAVSAARRAFDTGGWPGWPVEERIALLQR